MSESVNDPIFRLVAQRVDIAHRNPDLVVVLRCERGALVPLCRTRLYPLFSPMRRQPASLWWRTAPVRRLQQVSAWLLSCVGIICAPWPLP
jgi:hypothetical protein